MTSKEGCVWIKVYADILMVSSIYKRSTDAYFRWDVVWGPTEGAGCSIANDVLLAHAKVCQLAVAVRIQYHIVQLQISVDTYQLKNGVKPQTIIIRRPNGLMHPLFGEHTQASNAKARTCEFYMSTYPPGHTEYTNGKSKKEDLAEGNRCAINKTIHLWP